MIEEVSAEAPAYIGTATYSPEDNKLRLYPFARLDDADYQRIKAKGFRWAPQQKLFFKARWTPGAFDLLTRLCGEVGDEDTSFTERAEERASRFDGYRENRTSDAESAREAVSRIADNIPLGQPILIGHHSEKRARRDKDRIDNGMRKAVKMWETAEYWKGRAAGVLRHATYKERPEVRARRIKTIETDKRRCEKNNKESAFWLNAWTVTLNDDSKWKSKEDGTKPTMHERAVFLANRCRMIAAWDPIDATKVWRAYEVLQPDGERYKACPSMTPEQLQDVARETYPPAIAYNDRWIEHFDLRLAYERALLEEAGASSLLDPKPRAEQPPLLNYRAPAGTITVRNRYHRGETITYQQVDMTKAEYAAINVDYKGTSPSLDKSHRIRTAMHRQSGMRLVAVFLTDSKAHEIPAAAPAPEYPDASIPDRPAPRQARAVVSDPRAEQFKELKDQLKGGGVKVVVAPQLFPTPATLAARMVEIAQIKPGHRVLEPSSGTLRLVSAVRNAEPDARIVHVEIDRALCISSGAINRDFMECTPEEMGGLFDVILMNPPFVDGQDMAHVMHAWQFLKPGGVLVAIMGEGAFFRQDRKATEFRRWLDGVGGTSEQLSPDTFKESGAGVNTRLVTARR